MTRHATALLAALATVTAVAAPRVSAQEGRFGSAGAPAESPGPGGGWTITPSLLYSANWDDNVLLKQRVDEPRGDFLNVLNPRVDAGFGGRRGEFSGSYDGAFLLYRDLNTLNSYDQHGSVSGTRQLSKHVRLFVTDTLAVTPTTELALLVGVPFMRTGVRLNDVRSGIDANLTKRTSISVTYRFEWVRFDQQTGFATTLLGGQSQGGTFVARHRLSEFTSLTADYERHFSDIGGLGRFDVQNASGGVDRRLSATLRVYGSLGISRLSPDAAFGPTHTAPRYHAGVSQRLQRGSLDVLYNHSFAPSYSASGATESSDFSVRLNMPLWRRAYTQSAFSWRSDQYPLLSNATLRSRWFEASVGYLATPWIRIEGFYGGAYQSTILPGGALDRNRFGFQVITVKPVRIR
jgi:hypothetical protein